MQPRVRQGTGVVGVVLLSMSLPALGAPREPGAATERATSSAASPVLVPPAPKETPVEYPEGGEGDAQVVLDITIGVDGKVTGAAVVSGEAPFDDAALRSVRDWRFEPARSDGRPVAARIRYALGFEPSPDAKSPPQAPAGGAGEPAPPPGEASVEVTGEPTEVVVRGTRHVPGSVTLVSSDVRSMPGAFGDPLRARDAPPCVVPIVSGVPC